MATPLLQPGTSPRGQMRRPLSSVFLGVFYVYVPLISLQWFSSGSTFSEYAEGGHYKMSKTDKRENIILVLHYAMLPPFDDLISLIDRLPVSRSHSRRVSGVDCSLRVSMGLPGITADWMEIRTNHMAVITPKMNLLQIPIIDKFYVAPSDPAATSRAVEFAAAKGFLSPRRDTIVAH